MKTRIAIFFLVFCFATPIPLSAQATDCNDPHASPEANAAAQQAWEDRSSPVYADATNLAQDLALHGFVVQCIRRSKEERLFKGQKGAAWFKTDQGIFEVWFLPTPDTFAGSQSEVIEQPLTGGPTQFYIKSGNMVFHVMSDKQLAMNLHKAFQKPGSGAV
jgi:hypothetical protein